MSGLNVCIVESLMFNSYVPAWVLVLSIFFNDLAKYCFALEQNMFGIVVSVLMIVMVYKHAVEVHKT